MSFAQDFIGVYRDYPYFFAAMAAVIGAIVGSFLNVVVYRLPKIVEREYTSSAHALLDLPDLAPATPFTLSRPSSHCPACSAPIRWFDNIPILSWLSLRASCRSCAARIPARYFLIETLTAGVTSCMALAYGPTPQFLLASILAWHLIVIALIDAEHHIVLDEVVMPAMLLLAIAVSLGCGIVGSVEAVQGLVVGYLPMLLLWKVLHTLSDRPLLGQGDAGILAIIGAAIGPLPVVATLFAAASLHTAAALIFYSKSKTLPFAPAIVTVGILHIMLFPFMPAGLW